MHFTLGLLASWPREASRLEVALHKAKAKTHEAEAKARFFGLEAEARPRGLTSLLGPRDHVTPAIYELHWFPIAERIKFKLCLLVYHAVNGRAPSYLTELVTPVANIPGRASLRSAGRLDLVVQRSRLVSSERVFFVAAPRAWSGLPVDIRLITDTKLFKKKLKTFLFNSAYHGIRQ